MKIRFSVVLRHIIVLAALVNLLTVVVSGAEDLYRELRVSRSAGTKEIRNSFRRLAKEWHPDKNKSPQAKEKFIKINQAYEILSDEEKRRKYDLTGEIGDSPQQRQPFSGQGFTVFQFQGGNTFQFRFNTGTRSQRNDGVTASSFFDSILPNSHRKPFLLNFYTDFCFQCGQVHHLWNQLKRELQPLGVGLGSVHANLHPRVTQHCSVSRVPSIVGVVSGRVTHLHGPIQDVRTIIDFLEDILPSEIVKTLTKDNMDSFLSKALPHNTPRVVLFTLDLSPSLSHKLTAFKNQETVAIGHVTTHPQRQSRAVLSRFEVHIGERQLVHVYKEDYRAAYIIEEVDMNGERLKMLVETLTLYLPRLSSQKWLNRVCPLDGANRLCVVLLVEGSSSYNDSSTSSFRELPKKGVSSSSFSHLKFSFSYLDLSRQSKFVESFRLKEVGLRECAGGLHARPVLLMSRMSSQLVWFNLYDQFCGGFEDVLTLEEFLSSFSPNKMERSATVPHLLDEDAPGWFRQLLNDVLQFHYDVYDYILAIDPQILTPTVTLLCATILLCLVGLFTGGSQDSEEEQNSRRARSPSPASRQPHPSQESPTQIFPLDKRRYSQLVQNGPRGLLTMVLLVDSNQKEENRILAQTFWKIASRYFTPRVQVCYVCYSGRERWLGALLKCCREMTSSDIDTRVRGCNGGKIATLVALFGSRKQLSVFPETIATTTSNTTAAAAVYSNGSITTPTCMYKTSSSVIHRTSTGSRSEKSLGQVLGSTLGFEDEEENRGEFEENERHSIESDGTRRVSSDDGHSGTTRREGDKHSVHGQQPSLSNDPRVTQISTQLENWMEKLADGSLRRYNLEEWPEWDQLT